MAWELLSVDLDGDTFFATFSDGVIVVEFAGDLLTLTAEEAVFVRVHVLGPGSNRVGVRLRSIAALMKEILSVRRIRVEGATRTSGASPGRKPAPLVF